MCVVQILVAVELVGRHQRALLLLVEDVLHVDEFAALEVHVHSRAQELLDQHRNPPKSQPRMNCSSDLATCAKVGQSLTSSSVMPWMAVASSGMCISGLSLRVLTISSPSGMILAIEISTMRSLAVSTPVVSRSKKMIGRLRFNFI